MNGTISFTELQQLTGYERPGDLENCLKKQGVPVLRGKDGRPFTTIDALNNGMGLVQNQGDSIAKIDF